MTYRTTVRADQDIIDLYIDGIRQFGRDHAERYHEGLAATFELIDGNPLIARDRVEFTPPARLHPYRSHMIVYVLDDAGVLIVRVLHGRQDWERHMSPG
ncbi:type II toxin-antitoxin system RelE/ParE family toxin [Lichenicoccus sp.]|uniref:type II toxin-antitoxin system RelE/ParE family toxin n=1 Tax=Lichenicoccus sp. TaxID=2781899 RepID=UPI003D1242F9